MFPALFPNIPPPHSSSPSHFAITCTGPCSSKFLWLCWCCSLSWEHPSPSPAGEPCSLQNLAQEPFPLYSLLRHLPCVEFMKSVSLNCHAWCTHPPPILGHCALLFTLSNNLAQCSAQNKHFVNGNWLKSERRYRTLTGAISFPPRPWIWPWL